MCDCVGLEKSGLSYNEDVIMPFSNVLYIARIKLIYLFTKVTCLISIAVITNDIAALSIRKATSTLFGMLYLTHRIAASTANQRTIVGTAALTALGCRTECWRLFKVKKLLVARIIQRLAERNGGKVFAIESCSNCHETFATFSVRCTTKSFCCRNFSDRLMILFTKYSWRSVEVFELFPACLHWAASRDA